MSMIAPIKRLRLSNGRYTLLDTDDHARARSFKWSGGSSEYAYPHKNNGDNTWISLHRFVLGLTSKDKVEVDHINGNRLDNRKSNLRICSHQENISNQRIQTRKKSSKYKGVHWFKPKKLWVARIKVKQIIRLHKYFKSEKEAAIAYNEAAQKYFGEYALLNTL